MIIQFSCSYQCDRTRWERELCTSYWTCWQSWKVCTPIVQITRMWEYGATLWYYRSFQKVVWPFKRKERNANKWWVWEMKEQRKRNEKDQIKLQSYRSQMKLDTVYFWDKANSTIVMQIVLLCSYNTIVFLFQLQDGFGNITCIWSPWKGEVFLSGDIIIISLITL